MLRAFAIYFSDKNMALILMRHLLRLKTTAILRSSSWSTFRALLYLPQNFPLFLKLLSSQPTHRYVVLSLKAYAHCSRTYIALQRFHVGAILVFLGALTIQSAPLSSWANLKKHPIATDSAISSLQKGPFQSKVSMTMSQSEHSPTSAAASSEENAMQLVYIYMYIVLFLTYVFKHV